MYPIPKTIVPTLITWYEQFHRSLPWREDVSSYHTWISEIMLQQTRVETVIPYYLRFIEAIPTIDALASVDDETLHKLWEGLGYYRRCANLKKTAQLCVDNYQGQLPMSYTELLKLPGIGTYTAGAIMSIAFQKPYACVDGNVLRVLSRYLLSFDNIDLEKTKKIWKTSIEAILETKPGIFNQALMELGATICLPNGVARCSICPLSSTCQAYASGKVYQLPIRTQKKAREIECWTLFLLEDQEQILIQKRPSTGLLAHLYQLPSEPKHLDFKAVQNLFPCASLIETLPRYRHIFTHKEWHIQGFRIQISKNCCPLHGLWKDKKTILTQYTIPTAFRPYLDFSSFDY